MAISLDAALAKARKNVARSTELVDRQMALVDALERSGWDTYLARSLAYTMYRTRTLMIEHLDRLEKVEPVSRKRRFASLDEWVQLLTLATYTNDGQHRSH